MYSLVVDMRCYKSLILYSTFLPLLEKAVNLGVNRVAELFLGQAEKLATLYVSYCQGKTASEQLIVANLSFFNELQRFVKLDLPLSSYLIKPVQRITKYPLLLKVIVFMYFCNSLNYIPWRVIFGISVYCKSFEVEKFAVAELNFNLLENIRG